MIIENGHVEILYKRPGGLDPSTGHPQKGDERFGEPIPCQWMIARKDLQATTEQGEHRTDKSYVVLVEGGDWNAEQIRLSDNRGHILGVFSVQCFEFLYAVNQIKITV